MSTKKQAKEFFNFLEIATLEDYLATSTSIYEDSLHLEGLSKLINIFPFILKKGYFISS